MARAGVPCVPGYQGSDDSDATMASEAARIGFPVMIKAVAGGGGRGMRLVQDAGAFEDALRSAKSEAQAAFGDDRVILERAIIAPRHIEIQVFGDRQGNAIHLGERDCSVQRRHQKLIEEAPSPAVSADLRARMGAVATQAVKAIGYEGAGTLEFLLDGSGAFYFMEMNTRLQVEHPVTEAITGLDLVELQLRVATGEPLPLTQDEVRFSGHAIEVRLCAEDPSRDFMPQSGRMTQWRMPDGIRAEHALRPGDEVPPFYDSMIAKLIAYAPSRHAARAQLASALDRTIAFGIPTNQGFLAACLRHPTFASGGATTGFIGNHRDELMPSAISAQQLALAALLLFVTDPHAPPWQSGRSLAADFATPLRFGVGEETFDADVARSRDGSYNVAVDGHAMTLHVAGLDRECLRYAAGDGVLQSVRFDRQADQLELLVDGTVRTIRNLTRAAPQSSAAEGGDGRVRAAMNGRVVGVLVAAGDTVTVGQPIVTLEAMKMEHVHAARIAGQVAAVHATEGEQVTTGMVLVEIEPAPAQ
jgi:geranyl-CoA carboxylase alpha subunit